MKKLLYCAICIYLAFMAGCEDPEIVPEGASVMPEMALDAFNLINQHRESKGLPALQHLDAVYYAAQGHTEDMAVGTVPFGHDGFSERVADLKATMSIGTAGENVAYTSHSDAASHVVQMWLDSDGHRKNIEKAAYTHTGLAMVESAEGRYYFTQIFIELKE